MKTCQFILSHAAEIDIISGACLEGFELVPLFELQGVNILGNSHLSQTSGSGNHKRVKSKQGMDAAVCS